MIVRRYNDVISSLTDVERPLIETRLARLHQILDQALGGYLGFTMGQVPLIGVPVQKLGWINHK